MFLWDMVLQVYCSYVVISYQEVRLKVLGRLECMRCCTVEFQFIQAVALGGDSATVSRTAHWNLMLHVIHAKIGGTLFAPVHAFLTACDLGKDQKALATYE